MGAKIQAFDIFQTPLSSHYPLPLSIFNHKNCYKALRNMIQDVYSGSRSQKSTGSRITDSEVHVQIVSAQIVSAQFVSAQIVSAQIVSGTNCIGNKLYREHIVSGTNCIGNKLYREQTVSAPFHFFTLSFYS